MLQILLTLCVYFLSHVCEQAGAKYKCPEDAVLNYMEFQEKCYAFVTELKIWSEARRFCESRNADLVTIRNPAENTFILKEVVDWTHVHFAPRDWKFYKFVWIGFNDINDNQTWMWPDGTQASYTNWFPGEPNKNDAHCGQLVFNGRWDDFWCSKYGGLPFICQTDGILYTTTEKQADMSVDGITLPEEVTSVPSQASEAMAQATSEVMAQALKLKDKIPSVTRSRTSTAALICSIFALMIAILVAGYVGFSRRISKPGHSTLMNEQGF